LEFCYFKVGNADIHSSFIDKKWRVKGGVAD